jgi:hypothetical protein
MPFIYKPRQTTRLHITSGDQELTILVKDLPSTTLFELAQLYQSSSKHPASGDKTLIPAHFVREIIDAVVQNTADWEGVENPAGAPVPYSADTLRTVLESDVSFIPQLINYIVDLFTRSRREQRRLEDEEKNSQTSLPSPSAPASSDVDRPTAG